MRRLRLIAGYALGLLSVWLGVALGGGLGVAAGLWMQYDAGVARRFLAGDQVSQRGFAVVCCLTVIGAASAIGAILLWKQLCLKTGLLSKDEVARMMAGRHSSDRKKDGL
jgi:hypothetical protein